MTTKKAGKPRGRTLKLKKETIKDLEARGRGGKVEGGGVTALTCGAGMICNNPATQGCATAQYTNCNLSCVAVCGAGYHK